MSSGVQSRAGVAARARVGSLLGCGSLGRCAARAAGIGSAVSTTSRRSATGARENLLDLRAALSRMTNVAQEVLGEGADHGSLRDFYVALRLRVDYDPSTRIASATVSLDGTGGGSVCVRGGT